MFTLQQIVASALEGCCAPDGPFGTGGYPHFAVATAGLNGQQAAAVPSERLNSVWAIVNHLTHWQESTDSVLRGELVEPMTPVSAPGDTRYWPALPAEINDDAWQEARQACLGGNRRLVATIATMSDDQIAEPLPAYFNLTPEIVLPHILTHYSFHVGEIITIRHTQGLWVDHLFT